ncbi:MAG: GYF domain-containing protein [Planctomycetota bacterium]|nr:GYF domain-containing protein [Planctomycetota bacterium]
MSLQLKDNRWAVAPSDFAVRVIIPDLKGFFDKLPILGSAPKQRTLVIEPGTRALVIDDGMLIGEVGPGDYTLETFMERLKFWRNKQATIFLTRAEDVAIEMSFQDTPCLDSVLVNGQLRWTLQMGDVWLFVNNLMGANDTLSLDQLVQRLQPTVGQAVRDVIGTSNYDSIHGADFLPTLTDGILSRVDAKLSRYGLLFQDVQSFQTIGRDAVGKQKGELHLKQVETDLQRAAAGVANDRLKARLEEYQEKVPIRQSLREIVSEDKIEKIQSGEDFKKALVEVDKQRLLRKEEHDTLIEAYEDRKEDREQLRDHLLSTLDLQREQELESLRVDLDHAVRMQSMEKEIELARLSRSGDAEEWRADLERDKEEAQHHWEQKHEKTKARWNRIREERRQSRDDSWEDILHEKKMEEVQADLEIARGDRQRKVALLEAELNTRLEAQKLEVQKRQQEWDLEIQEKKSLNQMERLQKVQEMNAKFAEQQQRMQVEMENLKEDSAAKRQLDRINALSGLSTEALVATASSENAALLADMKKHEATQETAKLTATANPSAELDQERQRLYEKMNETERAKADAIAEAYKTAMQAQQGNVQQMIGGLAQAATPTSPQGFSAPQPAAPLMPAAAPPPMASAAPPPMPAAEVWHVSLNGQQSPPLQLAQVHQYVQTGQVNAATMVWKTGMPAWVAASQVPELAPYFASATGGPPTPPPS